MLSYAAYILILKNRLKKCLLKFQSTDACYYCNRVEKSDLRTLEREKVCGT